MAKANDAAVIDVVENHRAVNELRELTEKLEAANSKLREAEGLKGHFLSNIRNEINNPLAAIMGFAYQLKKGPVSAEQAARNGRLIYDEAFELNLQLENVFAAAGLEAGLETPSMAWVDVLAVLTEVLSQLEHRGHEKGIELLCSRSQPLPFVADPRFLRIILWNLVANALAFSPRLGTVSVEVAEIPEGLRIAITDEGPGIDAAHHKTVFDRFRQLDRGSCKRHRGHGLGLSISLALAELSGGTVIIDSAPGKGSTFTLTLPRPADDAAASAAGLFFSDDEERF